MAYQDINNMSLPNLSAEDKAIRDKRKTSLERTSGQLKDESLAGVDQASLGVIQSPDQMNVQNTAMGFSPAQGALSKALSDRASRSYLNSMNNIGIRQGFQAEKQRAANLSDVQTDLQRDLEMATKRAAFNRQKSDNYYNLNAEEAQLDFQDKMVAYKEVATKKHQELVEFVRAENKRRAEIAAKNKVIASILGVVGTVGGAVAGGLIGGPVGAGAGGMTGAAAAGALGPEPIKPVGGR